MTDNVVSFPKAEWPDIRGADRTGSHICLDGKKIPKMHMHDRGDEITFILDDRFLYIFPKPLAYAALDFAANAMAIGAGYANFKADEPFKPFAPNYGPLAPIETGTDETVQPAQPEG